MKKIIPILLILIIIVLGSLLFIEKKNYNTRKNDLEKELAVLQDKNESLEEEIKTTNEKLDNFQNWTCEYTQTFFYVGNYEYTANVPTHKFIVVDKFQEFSPIILEINTSEFDINFEKGKKYEITFQDSSNNKISYDKPVITSIVETDKLGFDQVQESCRITN